MSDSQDRIEQITKWMQANQRLMTGLGVALIVVAGGIWFAMSANRRREAIAEQNLLQARAAAEAGNLPLAASDLQSLIQRYGRTRSGQEAAITLGQIRLMQGQAELAAAELQTFVGEAKSQFRDQALGLLGTALEQSGQPANAADAYRRAAEATRYELVAVQMLLAAGRSYQTAGDTASAAASYQRILDEHPETGAVGEARLRLAELRRSDIPG